jgi:methylation protein EvaC
MTNELINFKNIALSNDLLDSQEQKPNLYDLKVIFDTNTKLVSIENNVESESMFNSNYVYDSSRSITMLKHFESAAIDLQRRFNPQKTLEIGSNSGIFIKHFPNDKSIAVEPCDNFAELTNKMGIKTYSDYWNRETCEKILSKHGKMDLVFSSNTISHVQNLNETLQSIKNILNDDGVFVLETPSFLEVLKYSAFDQFYHEHQSYFSLISLENLLDKIDMRIFDVSKHNVHGGTYRVMICNTKANYFDVDNSFYKDESDYGVDNFDKIKKRINIMKQNMVNIKDLLEDLKQKGNRVVGYGATAKFTNVMNMCGLDNTHIDYVLDTTPLKNNKWIPNTNVQIKAYSPQNIKDINYFYLGAWNYKKEILEKESDTHIPKVKILK